MYLVQTNPPGGTVTRTLHSAAIGGVADVGVALDLTTSVSEFAISADSSRVAYIGAPIAGGDSVLWSIDLQGGAPIQLSGTLVLSSNSFQTDLLISADSSVVVFKATDGFTTPELYSVAIGGGGAVKLSGTPQVSGSTFLSDFAIGPNSSRVVYRAKQASTLTELFSVPISGGSQTRLNSNLQALGTVSEFVISPDGNWVTYLADASVDQRIDAFSVPIDGGAVNLLSESFGSSGDTFQVEFTPDSARVTLLQTNTLGELALLAVDVGGTNRQTLSATSPATVSVRSYAMAPDGSRLFFPQADDDFAFNLFSVPITGGGATRIGPVLGSRVEQPMVSHDGQFVLYIDEALDGAEGTYIVAGAGGAATRIADAAGRHQFFSTSQQILFEEVPTGSIFDPPVLFRQALPDGTRETLVDVTGVGARVEDDWVITNNDTHLIYRSNELNPTQSSQPNDLFALQLISVAATVADTVGFEPNGMVEVLLTLSQPAGASGASIGFATVEGTATAGDDYAPLTTTVFFAAGEQVKTVSIELVDDTVAEGDETFQIQLADAQGTAIERGNATVVIRDSLPVARPLVAASVLPATRTVQLGETASAFASVLNVAGENLFGCGITPITSVPANFSYQTTDPSTNQVIGVRDVPVFIPIGGLQTFVFSFVPFEAFDPTSIQLDFSCVDESFATTVPGLNTFQLAASVDPVPDIIALTTVVDLPLTIDEGGVFAVATANVGALGEITVSADTGNTGLPLALLVCETDPILGTCTSAVGSSVNATFPTGATPTFAIFVTATDGIANDPANHRIVVRFIDASGIERGSTSTAVRAVP